MKKSSKLFSAILAVLLMVSALGTVPANAAEAEVTVNSLPELQEAIAAAVDGDTIHIAGDIEIQEEGPLIKPCSSPEPKGQALSFQYRRIFQMGSLSLLRILYFAAVRAVAFHLSRAGAPLISRQ